MFLLFSIGVYTSYVHKTTPNSPNTNERTSETRCALCRHSTAQYSTAALGALVRHIVMYMMIKVEFENNLANVKSCQPRSRCWLIGW